MEQTYTKFAKLLSFFVLFVSYILIVDRIFGMEIMDRWVPQWGTTLFSVDLAFFCSAIIAYGAACAVHIERRSLFAESFTPACILIILLLMSTLALSALLEIHTSVEDFFLPETSEGFIAVQTLPSMGTLIGYILIVLGGINSMFIHRSMAVRMWMIGTVLFLTSASSMVGHIINQPLLTFSFGSLSHPMPLNVSILFMVLALTFLLCGLTESKTKQ